MSENQKFIGLGTAYVEEVLEQGNQALQDTDFELICVEMDTSVRPRMSRPLLEHFRLSMPGSDKDGNEENAELLKHFINKMELVFKKVRKKK